MLTVSYSHLYMAEVGGVSGALVCDCVYLMLVVFPVHSLVELRFLVFLVSFAASGKCGCTAVCCCSEGLQEASNGF